MLLAGVLQVVCAFFPLVLVSVVAAFFGAAMHPVLNAHSQAIWQSYTPRELQGRVFSIRRLIAWAVMRVSTASAGGLAGVLDPGYVFASPGLICAVFCTAHLCHPSLLRAGDQ